MRFENKRYVNSIFLRVIKSSLLWFFSLLAIQVIMREELLVYELFIIINRIIGID